MKVILSIRPEYAAKILDGSKRYEFRRHLWKKDVESIVIYSTSPESMVVGEAKIRGIIALPPLELWRETREFAGISYRGFRRYFRGVDMAYAVALFDPVTYRIPRSIKETGMARPPQSFAYTFTF